MKLRIGTRGSRLALAQSKWVREKIIKEHSGIGVDLVVIKTKGDKILDSPLAEIGGKGLFVKEIEEALIDNRIDLAVHSIKDVPAELPEGLHINVFPEREEPGDAFVSFECQSIEDLPWEASVGTGSLRRSSQLLYLRPDLKIVPVRGNVDTRLRRLESGELKALILAAAGLRRLGLGEKISSLLSTGEFLPAIGQGALGLETRQNDDSTLKLIGFLNDKNTEITVRAERAFLLRLEGGCQVPIAGHAKMEDEKNIVLEGMVAELDGTRIIRDSIRGSAESPEKLGISLAERLLDAGAKNILNGVYVR